ncbi:MAG: tRNA(His) guanylyltransferase Thg1 family protein [Euryarchaeota archaeon]|nr:tRNA(His) guanylyltransferase Thg1 family protein [Euryarchaeota archaeon]
MSVSDFRNHEIYADLIATPPVIIRVDGRSFKNLLQRHGFEKPFDRRFASAMAGATESLFQQSGLYPVVAYTFSDEINILFRDVLPFDGRIEKLVSVVPSSISSALTRSLKISPIAFDGRVIPLHPGQIIEYLVWRQAEAWRNCINGYGHYTLRSDGLSGKEAASRMLGLRASDIHELCFQHGINLGKVPLWQRRGVLVYWEEYTKPGYDPVRDIEVVVNRKRVTQNWDLPIFASDEGGVMVRELVEELCVGSDGQHRRKH